MDERLKRLKAKLSKLDSEFRPLYNEWVRHTDDCPECKPARFCEDGRRLYDAWQQNLARGTKLKTEIDSLSS